MRVLFVPSGNNAVSYQRCAEALRIWRAAGYDVIIVSGGTKPNACAMKEWILRQPGAPKPGDIITENRSLDTYQNVEFSLNLIAVRYPGVKISKIGIVTDSLHGYRVELTMKRGCGVKAYLKLHPTPEPLGLKDVLFELVYIAIHLLDPKGNNFLATINRQSRQA